MARTWEEVSVKALWIVRCKRLSPWGWENKFSGDVLSKLAFTTSRPVMGELSWHTSCRKLMFLPVAMIFLTQFKVINFGIMELRTLYLSCQSRSPDAFGSEAMKNSLKGSSRVPSQIHLSNMRYIGWHTVQRMEWTVWELVSSPCRKKE